MSSFIRDFKLVELIIKSKPPEWSNDGRVYHTQHLILLKANHKKHQLLVQRSLVPVLKSVSKNKSDIGGQK